MNWIPACLFGVLVLFGLWFAYSLCKICGDEEEQDGTRYEG